MMRNEAYDEKQRLDRGKAFQYGLIAAFLTATLLFLATDAFGIQISSFASFLFQLWTPLTVCLVAFIQKDAIDSLNEPLGRILAIGYGLLGFLFFVMLSIRFISGDEALIADDVITDTAGDLHIALCMVGVSLTYWIRQRRNRKKYADY